MLYFPTVHVHDRQIHPSADFDHMLYCQPDSDTTEYLERWEMSHQPASDFIDVERTEGIVDSSRHCWRLSLQGMLENKDTVVGEGGTTPEYSKA